MTVHLFTTTDLAGEREATFLRLLDSIARNHASGTDLRIHVMLQNCRAEALADRLARLPVQSRLCVTPGRLPVSVARNRLMAAALAEGRFGDDDVVAFPDDDCWYTDGFVARLEAAFRDRPALDLLLCRVSLDPDEDPGALGDIAPATTACVVRLTMSNSLFVRGRVAAALGPFDAALGLGTPAQGGEDTDYAVRAFLAGRETGFVDRALVGHPPADQRAAARYFHGATLVLAQHARRSPGLMREFLRKLLVGVYFVGRGRLPVRTYLEAVRDGAGAFAASFSQRDRHGRPADHGAAGNTPSRPLVR